VTESNPTQYEPLTREEMVRVIEGRGCARRVPALLHQWTYPRAFEDPADRAAVEALLAAYPQDAQFIRWRNVEIYAAPEDDPQYRWMPTDKPDTPEVKAIDAHAPLADWDMLDDVLAAFPSAEYPGLFPHVPDDDGRYRIAHWWFTLFERHWSLRGMTNALMDYYTNPDEVHRLFRALTDFYLRIIERARNECDADAIYVTDDLGTQTGPFFSPEVFDTFYAPYYAELIDAAHARDMHFWLHCCGDIEELIPRLIGLGLDVLHPIQKFAMDETRIAREFGGQLAFWVGFDVQQTIPYGTVDEVRQEVRHLFDTYYREDGRLLFTMGNGITGDTPIPSLEALYEEAYAYGTEIVTQRGPMSPDLHRPAHDA
jgi:uroporphyrinogen decarboxylase